MVRFVFYFLLHDYYDYYHPQLGNKDLVSLASELQCVCSHIDNTDEDDSEEDDTDEDDIGEDDSEEDDAEEGDAEEDDAEADEDTEQIEMIGQCLDMSDDGGLK